MSNDTVIPGVYRHYKSQPFILGGEKVSYDKIYDVFGEGIHTETGEVGVFYRSLYGEYRLNFRPKYGPKGFCTPEGDTPRFTLITD